MAHNHSSVVTNCFKFLDGAHGNQDPLAVTRGEIHEFISMTIDFSLDAGVVFHHFDFVKKLWSNLSPELKGKFRKTPSREDLFKENHDTELENYKMKEECH